MVQGQLLMGEAVQGFAQGLSKPRRVGDESKWTGTAVQGQLLMSPGVSGVRQREVLGEQGAG